MLLLIMWNSFVYLYSALFTTGVFIVWFLVALVSPAAWDALLGMDLADFGGIFYDVVDEMIWEVK